MSTPNQKFSTYTALPGQRWDTIAFIHYQDAFAFEGLLAANVEHVRVIAFEGGEVLRVPVLETVNTIKRVGLPPWRK